MLEFLERAEDKFANMGPLGSDIDAVKKQIAQLKNFKDEVDPQMVKVEALNRLVNLIFNKYFYHGKNDRNNGSAMQDSFLIVSIFLAKKAHGIFNKE